MTEPHDPNQEGYRPAPQPWSPPFQAAPDGAPSYTPPPQSGPPQFGSPPQFGPPQSGGPQPGWYGAEGQWFPQPPPSKSSGTRTAIIAAVVVAVLAVAGVGTWLALRKDDGSTNSKKYTAAASFAGYSQIHNAAADRVESAIRSLGTSAAGGAAKRIFDAATIGVYSHNTGDQPVLIALIVPTSVSGSSGGDDVARQMLAGAVTDSTTFPSGSHGGSTRCGTAIFGAARETMCAWSDGDASGLLVSVIEPMTASGLASVTQSFRDASE